jgi:hypothetical protein
VHLIFLFLMTSCLTSYGSEIQSVSQHINLRKQNKIGRQQDLIGKFNLTRKVDIGIQGTYLERFDLFEKRFGGFIQTRLNNRLNLEIRYLQGFKSEILPEKQTIITSYFSYASGVTPFITLKDTRYSVTHLNNVGLGFELEKIPNIILIPSASIGRAIFKNPAESRDIYSLGMKATYYIENKFSVSLFGYKGREVSQGLVGTTSTTLPIDTLSGGAAISYFLFNDLKAEIIFDHTNYDQLKTEFHTTTLNLTWMF